MLNYALALMLTILAVAATFIDYGIVRTLFTLPLVFVLPGYAITAAWSPTRLSAFPANILFTLTLSIAASVIGGLVLNFTPWGLQTISWVIWLAGITVFHLIAALPRQETPPLVTADLLPTGFRFSHWVFIGAAIALSFFALYVARLGADAQSNPGFSQLWLTQADEPNRIDVGVHNQEGQPTSYTLVIEGGAARIEREFEIDANTDWETSLQLPPGHGAEINAYLYRSDNPDDIYRTTRLWLTDTE
jgi:uncharacterized membrane protein